MLLSDRRKRQSEQQHDEPEKQAPVVRSGRPRDFNAKRLKSKEYWMSFPVLGIDSDHNSEFLMTYSLVTA